MKAIKSGKYDLSKFSISSDLGILTLERGFVGEETPFTLLNTLRILVKEKGVTFEDALPLITTNALFPIEKRDELVYDNAECKLLVLNNELKIEKIIFNGVVNSKL